MKLDDLEACAERDGKRMVYPLCISGTEMIAVEPGSGYYDRYLPECINAAKFAVAFEVQKSDKIPADEFDIRVQAVISEAGINRVKEFI